VSSPSERHYLLADYIKEKTLFTAYDKPEDQLQRFTFQMTHRTSATWMPPAPFVRAITGYMSYDYDMEIATGKVNILWIPNMREIVASLDKWQLTGDRSRLIALAIPRLQVREINHRIEQVEENQKSLAPYKLSDHMSDHLFQIVIEKTIKYLKYNLDWITKYIKEHENSSLGQGHKWYEAYTLTPSDWRDIADHIKAMLEYLQQHPGTYLNIPYNIGSRARSPDLERLIPSEAWQTESFEIDRTRIITFYALLSLITAFIPQKAAWYKEVLDEVYKAIHASVDIEYPYVLGGQIYTRMAEMQREYPTLFHAADGKAWEAFTAQILGKAFNPFWVKVGPLEILPSGITFTSMLDTIANLVVNKDLHVIKLLALGDDMNAWGHVNLNRGFSEESKTDTRDGYMLGVAVGPVIGGRRQYVDSPRLKGVRVTLDRRDKMIPLAMPLPGDITPFEKERAYDVRMVALYWGLYKGRFGNRTLLESLESITPDEFRSPREYFEEQITTEESAAQLDVFAWAEETGYKPVITAPEFTTRRVGQLTYPTL